MYLKNININIVFLYLSFAVTYIICQILSKNIKMLAMNRNTKEYFYVDNYQRTVKELESRE